jgi:hypothetical protein
MLIEYDFNQIVLERAFSILYGATLGIGTSISRMLNLFIDNRLKSLIDLIDFWPELGVATQNSLGAGPGSGLFVIKPSFRVEPVEVFPDLEL